eukprot:2978300-Alexandrium_andersonii.AAC.1
MLASPWPRTSDPGRRRYRHAPRPWLHYAATQSSWTTPTTAETMCAQQSWPLTRPDRTCRPGGRGPRRRRPGRAGGGRRRFG